VAPDQTARQALGFNPGKDSAAAIAALDRGGLVFDVLGHKYEMYIETRNGVASTHEIEAFCRTHGVIIHSMLVRKAFRFRLNASEEQRAVFSQTAGCCRFIWNSALALQKQRLRRGGKLLNYSELCRELTAARNSEGLEFLREVHSKPQQQTLKDLCRAFRDAFDKSQPNKRFPRFKKKGRRDSFRHPENVIVDGKRVKLPGIGWIGFRKSRDIDGTIKNATVSHRGDHWFVSIQTEIEIAKPVHPSRTMVGVDMGIKKFAALSRGKPIQPLNSFKRLEAKMAKEQQKLSRKKKFSNNWKKQKSRIARLHIRIADSRNNFLHQTSHVISKSHAVICMEDLKVANMSKSAKGTREEPGKNVRAKAGLNKAILGQGWYEFRRQLEYKQLWRGGELIVVPAHHTSQMCSECSHVDTANRKTQESFVCLRCGFSENADVNAARNIEAAGSAVLACGSNPTRGRKQEPLAA